MNTADRIGLSVTLRAPKAYHNPYMDLGSSTSAA
jgi:hypothetical protein